jgi:probable F420-dependent oxidoreductase
MRFTINLHGMHALLGDDIRAVVDVAARADGLGIHCVSLPDHVAMGTRVDRYPYGTFPLPESFPWYEPLTVLAAVAAATERIHLTTSVLISPLRPAVLLAKIAASLDRLSRGRFELGAGTGWQREEFDAVGVPFADRTARMIDGLRACVALWRGERVSFDSPSVSFEEILSLPAPSRPIPLWLGMKPTPRARAWMAELGAGWVPMATAPEQLAADIDAIRETYAKQGRDADTLRVRAGLPLRIGADRRPDLAATLDGVAAAAAVGVTDVEFFLRACAGSPADLDTALAAIAKHCAGLPRRSNNRHR